MELTAHVADDLLPELVLPVPAELEVALEPLNVGLQLDDESEGCRTRFNLCTRQLSLHVLVNPNQNSRG
jgi:hypothetical protein